MTKHTILNLAKYDLKFIYKQLAIFYIIILVCAIIARLTNFDQPSFWLKFLHEFTQGAALGFSFGALVNGSIRTWARFRSSLYGDESYLTHTLPISRNTLWASKFLASLIIGFVSITVIVLAILILFPSGVIPEMIQIYNSQNFSIGFWPLLITFILLLFCQFTYIMQNGFTGILIGHRFNDRRLLLSNIFGVAAYLFGGIVILVTCFIISIFNSAIRDMLFSPETYIAPDMLFQLIAVITTTYIALIIGSYFFNQHLLKKGVNVD